MTSAKITKAVLALTWVVTFGSLTALWNLGWIGVPSFEMGIHYETPRPGLFAVVLCLCLLSATGLIGHGAWRLWLGQRWNTGIHLLFGIGAASSAGHFIHEVLAIDDTNIPVANRNSAPVHRVKALRLFNLNVLHGYPEFERQQERMRKISDIVGHFRADIVVLQEVGDSVACGNMLDYLVNVDSQHVYGRANGSRRLIGFEEGGAVLSRFPIRECKRMVLSPRKPIWENRIALLAKLDLGGNETLTVVGVHLSNSPAAHDQAEFLIAALRENPPDIIVGDLNAGPGSRAVQTIIEAGYAEVVPTKAIHGMRHYELPHELVTGPIIDHLFLSDGFRKNWRVAQASWVLTSKPVNADATHAREAVSDHDAIVVDLDRE